jgi:hypothetical protein
MLVKRVPKQRTRKQYTVNNIHPVYATDEEREQKKAKIFRALLNIYRRSAGEEPLSADETIILLKPGAEAALYTDGNSVSV